MRVAALRRLAEQAGAYPMILRRGDDGAGVLLVQISCHGKQPEIWESLPDAARGKAIWQRSGPVDKPGMVADPDALNAWLDRRISRDPDLWIVELDGPDLESLRALFKEFEA